MDNYLDEFFDADQSIPEILHSDYRKGHFQECLKCERDLQEIQGVYEIQKIYRQGRPIWEHAICSKCGQEMIDDYSDESLDRIEQFMSRLDLDEDTMERCHRCGTTVETGSEHMISTLCSKDRMIMSPMVLCVDCLDQMNALLSDETRDNWDDFVRDHVPGLPAEQEPVPSDMPIPGM